jgi:hypothetical protein
MRYNAMTNTELPQTATRPSLSGERADLVDTLRKHRYLLRGTVRGLTDGQAAESPTASALCLGGLIKHVAEGERKWVDFILHGPSAMASGNKSWTDLDEGDYAAHSQTSGPVRRWVASRPIDGAKSMG